MADIQTKTPETKTADIKPAIVETAKAVASATDAAVKTIEAPAKTPARRARKIKAVTKTKRRGRPARRAKLATAGTRKTSATAGARRRKPATAGTRKTSVRAAATLKKGIRKMNNQTRKTIDTGILAADQFQNAFGEVNARAKNVAERSARFAEEFADITRGNVEAFVASSKVAAKGAERISQDAAEFGRRSFEEASAALKSLATVKSATELFRMQGDFARTAFDTTVAQSARMSENMLKLAGDVAEPITSRYNVAAARAKTLAA